MLGSGFWLLGSGKKWAEVSGQKGLARLRGRGIGGSIRRRWRLFPLWLVSGFKSVPIRVICGQIQHPESWN